MKIETQSAIKKNSIETSNSGRAARRKTYFSSEEIAHIWANQPAPYIQDGNCASNMSFRGTAFSSYGTVIARIIVHKGKRAFVLDDSGFSVSTSRHQGLVRRAIAKTETLFTIRGGSRGQYLDFTPQTLRNHYLEQSIEPLKTKFAGENQKIKRAKLAGEFLNGFFQLNRAMDVCIFFGLATNAVQKRVTKFKSQADAAAEIVNARKAELQDRQEAIIAKRDAHIIAQDQENIPKWRAGGNVSVSYRVATMLRVKEDVIETSHGARISLATGERAFKFIIARRAAGWHRNGEQFPLDNYQLDAITADGITAGCHEITWTEIELFAKSQGWTI